MPHYEASLSGSTYSQESLEQADKWLKRCVEDHKHCKSVFPKPTFLPHRLIEIEGYPDVDLRIRLRDRNMLDSPVAYASLSHCWGSKILFKLTRGNLKSCMEGIPFDKISKSSKTPYAFALCVGIRYIWIDSLCESVFIDGKVENISN